MDNLFSYLSLKRYLHINFYCNKCVKNSHLMEWHMSTKTKTEYTKMTRKPRSYLKIWKLGFCGLFVSSMNPKVDFWEKWGLTIKSRTETYLWKTFIACHLSKLVSEKHSVISIFAHILKLLVEIAPMFSTKCFLPSKLIAKSNSWSPKRPDSKKSKQHRPSSSRDVVIADQEIYTFIKNWIIG